MTTLDYGNLSSQILQEERAALIESATKQLTEQDQEYFGTQTYHNTVIFNLDVDLGALENAKYAVNAYSVKQYVNNFFNEILSPTANIEYKGKVTFSGLTPTQFAQSPVIHNALSLSSIDNLANFPNPERLKTPALVGDVKSYIDENFRLINLSLEYTAEQVVETRLNQILPDTVEYFIDITLGDKLAGFSDEYVFPRVKQQVSAALNEQVAPVVAAAIENDLATFKQSITTDYTTAIAQAIESIDQGNSWTEAQIQEIAAAVDNLTVPDIVDTQLNLKVAPMAKAAVADDLSALQASVTEAYKTDIAQAIEGIDQGNSWTESQIQNIAAAVDNLTVPDIVDTQLNLKVAPIAKAAVADDLSALQASVTEAYKTDIAQAIEGIEPGNSWTESQIQNIAAAVDNLTVPDIVDTQLNLKVAPIAKAAVADDLSALQASITEAYKTEVAQAIEGIELGNSWTESQIQNIAAAVDNLTVPDIVDTQLNLKVAPIAKAAVADDLSALQASVTEAYKTDIAQAIEGIDQSGGWTEAQIQEIAAAVDNLTVPDIVDTQLNIKVAPIAKAAVADDLSALQASVTEAYKTDIAQAIEGIEPGNSWTEAQIQNIAAAVDNLTVPDIVDTQLNSKVAPLAKAAVADDLSALQASVTEAYKTEIAQAIEGIEPGNSWTEAQIQNIAAAVDNLTVPDIVDTQLNLKVTPIAKAAVADDLSALQASVTEAYKTEIAQAIEGIEPGNSWTEAQIQNIAAAVDNLTVPDIVDTQLNLKVAPIAKAALADDLSALQASVTEAYKTEIAQAIEGIEPGNNWTEAQIQEIAAAVDNITVPDIVDTKLNAKLGPLAKETVAESLYVMAQSITQDYTAAITQAIAGIDQGTNWTEAKIQEIAAAVDNLTVPDIVDAQLNLKVAPIAKAALADDLDALETSVTTAYTAAITQAIEGIELGNNWTEAQIQNIAAAVDTLTVPDIVDTQLSLKVAPMAKAALADDLSALQANVTEAYKLEIAQAIEGIEPGNSWTEAQIQNIAAAVDTLTVPDIVDTQLNTKVAPLAKAALADDLSALQASVTEAYKTEIAQAIEGIDQSGGWTEAQIQEIAAAVDNLTVPDIVDTKLNAKLGPLAKETVAESLYVMAQSITQDYTAAITQAIAGIDQGTNWTEAQIQEIAAAVDTLTVPDIVDTQLNTKVAPLAKAALADDLDALEASVTAAYSAAIAQAIEGIEPSNSWTEAQIQNIAAAVDTLTVPDIVDTQLNLKVAPIAKAALADDLSALQANVTEAYKLEIAQAIEGIEPGNSWTEAQIQNIAAAVDTLTVPDIVDTQLNLKVAPLAKAALADDLNALETSVTTAYTAAITQAIEGIELGNNWTEAQIQEIAAAVDNLTVPDIVDTQLNLKVAPMAKAALADDLSALQASVTEAYKLEIAQAIEGIEPGNSWTEAQIQEIAAAVDNITVPDIVDARLNSKVAPLAKAALADDLDALETSVTAAYTAAIAQAIAGIDQGNAWTEAQIQAIAAGVDNITVPDIVDTKLNIKLGTLSESTVADSLSAMTQSITQTYRAEIAQAIEGIEPSNNWTEAQIQNIAAAVDSLTVPDIVDTQLNLKIAPLAKAALADDLNTLQASVTAAYKAEISQAIDAIELGNSWTEAQIQEIAAAVDNITVPDIVDTKLNAKLGALGDNTVADSLSAMAQTISQAYRAEIAQAIDSIELGNNWTEAQIKEIAAAVDTITVPDLINARLNEDVLWPIVAAKTAAQIDTTIDQTVLPKIAHEVDKQLPDILSTVVQLEISNQLPPLVDSEVDKAFGTITSGLPSLVEFKIDEGLKDAGSIATYFKNNVEALAQSIVQQYINTTVSPFIERTVPEYALSEVQAALQEAVPDLVNYTVRTVVDAEVDTLKSTFIPNLVTLKLTETVPQLVEDRMAQILTQVSLPKRLRFEFAQQSTQWIVQHERNTRDFSIEIFNSQGVRMFAHHEIIDDMSFVVSLTEALTGFIDVVFYS